ncbi:MAG TPA: NADH-quinone oxidoreductase subunit J [bacterium]
MSGFGTLVFAVLALVALGSALVVVASRRIVASALALVLCFLAVAGLFILQGAEFLGAVQILLYAGSIVVLFVFVVMLANLRGGEGADWSGLSAITGTILGGVVFAQLLAVVARARGWLAPASNGLAPGEGHVQVLGKVLFRQYLLPFEVLSVILLAALFGLIVIGRRK